MHCSLTCADNGKNQTITNEKYKNRSLCAQKPTDTHVVIYDAYRNSICQTMR
jgi:hypothetical protein